LSNRIVTETERVARAICWAFSEETDDCSSVCLNARRCMAEKVDPSFMRDARAALAAIYFPDADWDALRKLAAQGIEAGTDGTPKEVQPEGREPDPKDAP